MENRGIMKAKKGIKTPKKSIASSQKPEDFVLGQEYEIAPFGRSDIVKDSIGMARFVGYLQKRWGYPTSTTIKWPVFKTVHYGQPILYALDNGLCGARGENVKELMDDFAKNHSFWGVEHETIDVTQDGKVLLSKDEFIQQMGAAGIERSRLDECLNEGRYFTFYFNGGEIKWCPACGAMRQTTCCACGCGNCKVCGHRWICGTPVNLAPMLGAPTLLKV